MSRKILITDDDELVVISLEELLKTEGYEVSTANNGSAALKKIGQQDFDLIMLDVIMPGMSGFEVCAEIRKLPKHAETPIVMLTAKSAEADRQAGMDAGASRFLPKPIEPNRLLSTLADELDKV